MIEQLFFLPLGTATPAPEEPVADDKREYLFISAFYLSLFIFCSSILSFFGFQVHWNRFCIVSERPSKMYTFSEILSYFQKLLKFYPFTGMFLVSNLFMCIRSIGFGRESIMCCDRFAVVFQLSFIWKVRLFAP